MLFKLGEEAVAIRPGLVQITLHRSSTKESTSVQTEPATKKKKSLFSDYRCNYLNGSKSFCMHATAIGDGDPLRLLYS